MSTILDKIKAYKLVEIENAKRAVPLRELEDQARIAPPPRGFARALRSASQSGYALIAEIKKASPSKGLIRADFAPAKHALAYERGGAAFLSVLTDSPSFQGAPEYLGAVRAATSLPVLRKDFMYDSYQVSQARAWGADCILLIMASLSDAQASELEDAALAHNMDVLIEVHDEPELERATNLKSPLLRINNRNLKTFETDLDTTRRLTKLAPIDRLIICESGLNTASDLAGMATCGVRSFLIGESLMRQDDVETATRTILKSPLPVTGAR